MHKLVRDKIPDIIKENDQVPIVSVVSDVYTHMQYLVNKLNEEGLEFLEAYHEKTKDDQTEELCDIFEILKTLCVLSDIEIDEVWSYSEEKKNIRGSFIKGYILHEVKDSS